jgi:hypothetical protein
MNAIIVASNYLKNANDYSSVQFELPEDTAIQILDWGLRKIPDQLLAAEGREDDIHVTCKYGLHITDFTQVRDLFINERAIKITLGKISLFINDDADVVKIEVDSPDLYRLNQKISSLFEVTDTHPIYQPHITIAYVKRGLGIKYNGRADFTGQKVILDTVAFSGKDNRMTIFKLPH